MANTQAFKLVEKELRQLFIKKHKAKLISCGRILGMEFDLVAYSEEKKCLYIGEITASGYYGNQGKFHIGGARKLAESFSKCYLIKNNIENAGIEIRRSNPGLKWKKVGCYFIIPKGSEFITALGYRKKLLEAGIMNLEEYNLSAEMQDVLEKALKESREEQKLQKGRIN